MKIDLVCNGKPTPDPRRLASKDSFRIATAFFLINTSRLNIILTTGGSMHRVITACIQAVVKVDGILKMMELHVAVSTLHSFRRGIYS